MTDELELELRAEIARLTRENDTLLVICTQCHSMGELIAEYTKTPARVRQLREDARSRRFVTRPDGTLVELP